MNITGTAQNVWLQLYPGLGNWEILMLGGTWISDTYEGIKILAGSNSGTRDYYVNYYTPSGLTPVAGTVRGAVQYTVTYP